MNQEFTEYRVCRKCGQTIHRREYGSQAYCKPCWSTYNYARRKARKRIEDGYGEQTEADYLAMLSPERQAAILAEQKPDLPPTLP